ncbi:hypothetical protein [Altererythrobacter lauratis]|uniref:Uncharacterized protein n=1 Tax=Alteraurantiacibacter lauratis TaxID=2054627 RepID=A0ABV7EH53_9SPHN
MGLDPSVEIEHVSVTVREVIQNSPLRHRVEGYVVAALSPGLTEDMPADILQALFGIDVPDSYDGFVSMLVLVVSLWGAEKVIQRLKRAKEERAEKKTLEEREQKLAEERRRLTEEAAEKVGISEDQLVEALIKVLSQRPVSVGKQSMDFLNPARRHRATAVRLPGGEAISEEALRALPSDVEMAGYQPSTETEPYEGVTVKFHAHDKDNPKRWAATISEVADGRKALHLAPEIDADALFTRDKVKADVLVTSVLDNQGDYQPSVYYLARVYDDKPA